jgi:hypothetical protein
MLEAVVAHASLHSFKGYWWRLRVKHGAGSQKMVLLVLYGTELPQHVVNRTWGNSMPKYFQVRRVAPGWSTNCCIEMRPPNRHMCACNGSCPCARRMNAHSKRVQLSVNGLQPYV